jgi:histidinol-phosphate phosphatase family protein
MLHRAVFLDRDGTIAKDVHYCRDPKDFDLLPRVPTAIRLLNQRAYKVIVVTNQSGIARGYFSQQVLTSIHHKMTTELSMQGAFVDSIYVCPHHPDDGCECRKPKPSLLLKAASDIGIALDRSYMVGDDLKDVQAGRAAGCRTVWLSSNPNQPNGESLRFSDHIAADLFDAVEWLLDDASGQGCQRDYDDNGRRDQ